MTRTYSRGWNYSADSEGWGTAPSTRGWGYSDDGGSGHFSAVYGRIWG